MRVGTMTQPQPQPQPQIGSPSVVPDVMVADASTSSSSIEKGGDSSTSSSGAMLQNWAPNARDAVFPFKAIKVMAIAVASLVSVVSFVPLWTLYSQHPTLWFSQKMSSDLWWIWSAATAAAAATFSRNSCSPSAAGDGGNVMAAAGAVASMAYNEVNEISVRRALAKKLRPATAEVDVDRIYGFSQTSERRVCEFGNSRGQTLFTQSWIPPLPSSTATAAVPAIKGVILLLHGLNEHSGRYASFASQLNHQGYGVYAMDWIGHGGSDGLHGYVESLDQVVLDTKLYLKQVMAEHPNVPVFLFGHSTGGAIALKASVLTSNEKMLKGVVLTAPAVRVKPSHPIIAALAPIFSILLPRFQFRGATKGGVAVCRDPLALVAKYSDPLVYTGPIRIRTGTEILRLGSFLRKNMEKVTIPFFVLHGSRDEIADPRGSRDLYEKAASKNKSIKVYNGLLHDLLFELEKDVITMDIIQWLNSMLPR